MLSSISPFGERARASRWWLTASAYGVSSVLGGLLVGAAAGLLGRLLPTSGHGERVALALASVLLVVGLLLDLGVAGLSLPSWRRQVDRSWVGQLRGWVMGIGFGAQLGLGLVTIITSATTYAMVLFAVLSGSVVAGMSVGATFGLVRAVPLLLLTRVRDREALHGVFATLDRWARPADLVAKVSLGAAALVLALAAGGIVS